MNGCEMNGWMNESVKCTRSVTCHLISSFLSLQSSPVTPHCTRSAAPELTPGMRIFQPLFYLRYMMVDYYLC